MNEISILGQREHYGEDVVDDGHVVSNAPRTFRCKVYVEGDPVRDIRVGPWVHATHRFRHKTSTDDPTLWLQFCLLSKVAVDIAISTFLPRRNSTVTDQGID